MSHVEVELRRPCFEVRVSVERCAFDVRFNDVSLIADPEGRPIVVTIPVSHWVHDGTNRLEVGVARRPDVSTFDAGAACRATLTVRCLENGGLARSIMCVAWEPSMGVLSPEEESPPALSPWPSPDAFGPEVRQSKPAGGFCVGRSVMLASTFPRWAWLDAEPIAPSAATRADLWTLYREIWGDLEARRLDQVRQRLSERSAELDRAYFKPSGSTLRSVGIEEYAESQTYALWPLPPISEVKLDVFASGRLARLTRVDGEPVIVFVRNDGALSAYYDLSFCRRGSCWAVIR